MGRLKMPVAYRLSDPGFTIYHRAALGGLAATIRSWTGRRHGVPAPLTFDEDRSINGGVLRDDQGRSVRAAVDSSSVTLAWDEPTTDRGALGLILQASFRCTDNEMIYLPGQGFGPERKDVLIAAHNALAQTFLQHNKKRPGIGEGQVVILDDDGESHAFTYKNVVRYAHQVAQASGLLSDGKGWEVEAGDLPDQASLTQTTLPGATGGTADLATSPEHAFLLQFLMVACPVFAIRSRKWEAKTRNCLVVPDVSDLRAFAEGLEEIGTNPIRRTNSYLGRIAGGAEEAAMRFLMDHRGIETVEKRGISGAHVYAMGDVAWVPNQQNRSWVARVKTPSEYPDFGVFEAADRTLGRAKIIQTKNGPFAIPGSPLPDLIAANLAAGRPVVRRLPRSRGQEEGLCGPQLSTGGIEGDEKRDP